LQAELSDRMQGIERAMMTARPSAPVDLAPVLERLVELERAVAAPRPAPHLDLSAITNRLDMIEEVMLSQETAGLNEMLARIKAMEDGLKTLEATVASERVRAAEAQAALVNEIRALTEAVVTPVTERLDAVTAHLDQQAADAGTRMREIADRVTALDGAVAATARKADEVQTAHVQELKELHDAVMKLNTNQHTLAGSIDQWRRDSTAQMASTADRLHLVGGAVDSIALSLGSLGSGVSGLTSSMASIGTRLETVEKESAKPIAMLETVSGTLDKMHKVTVERYYRRNRVWYWLFGTDDWVAASWPSQAARIVDDLKIVRTAPPATSTKK
jgi:chromosome segregation ATPase